MDTTNKLVMEESVQPKQTHAAPSPLPKQGSFEYLLSEQLWRGSPHYCRIFGLDPARSYTLNEYESHIHPADRLLFHTLLDFALRTGERFDLDYRLMGPAEEVIHVRTLSEVVYDQEGTPRMIIGTQRDISAEKDKEAHLLLENERLQLQNRDLDIFFYSIGHDLKAPINSALGLLNIIKNSSGETQTTTD
ncbi:MAG: PAS domain-containing protein, partial [Cytophagales bacterium]|nr:PAS domain-containing protein [Cytophagales bacterium]